MFIQKEELKSTMYSYQLEQISEGDDSIILMGINAAVDEVKSYLTSNNKKTWIDGRPLYDVATIFAATGNNRNALLLEITKTVAEWWIIKLCNADAIYEHVKERYDRAITYLKQLGKGEVTISSLPLLPTDGSNNAETIAPFRMGGRPKFSHE
ncbi:phage protein Gp36 family protein [Ferruginibacter yonginensis]|uniref:Phage protein Gp36 family protein n=1 Tax=Ferruginibacter yonginensis TaxID=1310416 RepID=A0ABV8QRU3_9BACT